MTPVLFLAWGATALYVAHLHKRIRVLEHRQRSLRASCGAHVGVNYAHTHPIHLFYDGNVK